MQTEIINLTPNYKKKEETAPLMIEDETPTKELAYIRHKREYRRFITMCKHGKITTGVLTAKVLGVSEQTIHEWLRTPTAKKALLENAEKYVANIEVSKDWKAQQYLLEKLTLTEQHDKQNNTLVGLQITLQK